MNVVEIPGPFSTLVVVVFFVVLFFLGGGGGGLEQASKNTRGTIKYETWRIHSIFCQPGP